MRSESAGEKFQREAKREWEESCWRRYRTRFWTAPSCHHLVWDCLESDCNFPVNVKGCRYPAYKELYTFLVASSLYAFSGTHVGGCVCVCVWSAVGCTHAGLGMREERVSTIYLNMWGRGFAFSACSKHQACDTSFSPGWLAKMQHTYYTQTKEYARDTRMFPGLNSLFFMKPSGLCSPHTLVLYRRSYSI